jgi:hypothetical protein
VKLKYATIDRTVIFFIRSGCCSCNACGLFFLLVRPCARQEGEDVLANDRINSSIDDE